MDMGGRGYGGGEGGETQTYRLELPKGETTACPVEGCPGKAGTRTAMRVHFWRMHVRDTIIILEEGNLPHPICENCDMFVPWQALNGCHKSTKMCRSGTSRKRRRLAEAELRKSTEMAFEVYRQQIQSVPWFTYLGRVITEGDDDWPAVAGNLAKVWKSWGRLQGILRREGATKRVSGTFFHSGSAAGADVWGGDVGGVPDDGVGAERISPWGGKTTHR